MTVIAAAQLAPVIGDADGNRRTAAAAVPPDQLYVGDSGGFEFHRTVSRLIEMQAADYLSARHVT